MTRARVLLFGAAALVLAACSSSDTQTPPTTGQTVTVTSVTTAAPVTTTVTFSATSSSSEPTTSAAEPTTQTPSPSSTATQAPGGTTLAGVSLDAAGEDVLAQLTEMFGKPDSDVWGAGCEMGGAATAVSREVTWGGLTVSGEGPDKESLRLTSYSVAPGAPRAVVIPHNVRFGMTLAEIQAALPPTATWVEDSLIGLPYFETPEGLFVVAEGEFETFRVNPLVCS